MPKFKVTLANNKVKNIHANYVRYKKNGDVVFTNVGYYDDTVYAISNGNWKEIEDQNKNKHAQ